jgi:hypothetical protein
LLAEKLRQASHSELVRYRVLVAAALFQSTVASLYLVTTPVSLASVPSVFVLMGYVGTLVLARRGTSPQAPALLLCIAPEHQWRVFTQGFTTKKMGHGFGLHSSALAASEMGGQLSCSSPGPGLGATFTLALPLRPAKPAGPE